MMSINREAMKIVRRVLEAPEPLGVHVIRLGNGATVLDMGQRARRLDGREVLHPHHARRPGRGEPGVT